MATMAKLIPKVGGLSIENSIIILYAVLMWISVVRKAINLDRSIKKTDKI